MANKQNRYKALERIMTIALIADAVIFFLFLLSAGLGIVWLKVFTAILAILASGLCLILLYMTGELLKQRSLWMSVGFAAILICLVFSLILNFPSPKAVKESDANAVGAVTTAFFSSDLTV